MRWQQKVPEDNFKTNLVIHEKLFFGHASLPEQKLHHFRSRLRSLQLTSRFRKKLLKWNSGFKKTFECVINDLFCGIWNRASNYETHTKKSYAFSKVSTQSWPGAKSRYWKENSIAREIIYEITLIEFWVCLQLMVKRGFTIRLKSFKPRAPEFGGPTILGVRTIPAFL